MNELNAVEWTIDRILERYESSDCRDNYLDDLDSLKNLTETNNEEFKNDCI